MAYALAYVIFFLYFCSVKRNSGIFIALGVLLVLLFGLDVCSGSMWLWPFGELNGMEQNILHAIRLPKAVTAILAGAALSVSGLIMQALFRNPLAVASMIVLIILLINMILMRSLTKQQVLEVPYSTFLQMVDGKVVKQADVESTQITFTAIKDGQTAVFQTGRMNDDTLIPRMLQAGVTFTTSIPEGLSFIRN